MDFHKLITDRGGKVLKHRTKVNELEIGDKFKVQSLKEEYEILFFWKDNIFDYSPFVLGRGEGDNCILITTDGLKVSTKKEQPIKRKRRTMQ